MVRRVPAGQPNLSTIPGASAIEQPARVIYNASSITAPTARPNNANPSNKEIVDVIDLSDDEDSAPKPKPKQQTQVRTLGTPQVILIKSFRGKLYR